MPDEPTLGELVRRLADITTQLSGISQQLRTDFVRKETYDAHREASRAELAEARSDIAEMKQARSEDTKWRRTASLSIALGSIGWLVTIVIAVVTIVLKVS